MNYTDAKLDFFGEEYELQLLNQVIGDKKSVDGRVRRDDNFGRKIIDYLSADHFNNPLAKGVIVSIKGYFNRKRKIPYYTTIKSMIKENLLNSKIDELKANMFLEFIKDIQKVVIDDVAWVKDSSINFINRRNILSKLDSIRSQVLAGKYESFDKFPGELKRAIITQGNDTRQEAFVAGDYRDMEEGERFPIPTGITALDEDLNGGVAPGELAIVVAGLKTGKAQPHFCKVYTPQGYKLMGDIKVGDKVLGSDGKSQNVIGVYPQGVKEYYKIEFSDNSETYCCNDHLWTVKSNGSYKVKSLSEIREGYRFDDGSLKYSIPKPQSVNFDSQLTLRDSYSVGLMCGNQANIFDVCIEDCFLYNSIDNRKKLLNGIIDSKLAVMLKDYTLIETNSKKFAQQIKFLAFSVGGSSILVEPLNPKKKYIVSIKLPDSKVKKPKYIQNITYVGTEECSCIKVSNEDELYITDDFILTHNTTFASVVANHAALQGFSVLQLFFEDTIPQVKMKHRTKFSSLNLSDVFKRKNKRSVKKLSDTQLKKMKKNGGCLVLHKLQASNATIDNIEQVIIDAKERGVWFEDEKAYKKIDYDLVLIDYLDCIKPAGRHQKKWEGDEEIIRGLETMCAPNKHNFALWTFTQGGRGSLNSELVETGDVGGSISKLQVAHLVCTIAKTIDQKPKGLATFAILGSRLGRDGIIYKDCTFDNATLTINMEKEQTLKDFFDDGNQLVVEDDDIGDPIEWN